MTFLCRGRSCKNFSATRWPDRFLKWEYEDALFVGRSFIVAKAIRNSAPADVNWRIINPAMHGAHTAESGRENTARR